jgi:hypothetical protein
VILLLLIASTVVVKILPALALAELETHMNLFMLHVGVVDKSTPV